MRFLKYVPKNHLSYVLGGLAHVPLPRPLARKLVRTFSDFYGIDSGTAAKPLEEYGSIGAYFLRDLREGLRPIEGGLVSPVDGTLRSAGPIKNQQIQQIKERDYSIATLLRSEEDAEIFREGYYFNLYLSPQDYHHVHSPVSGAITRSRYISGKLWPVNDWSLSSIEGLFTINERVVTFIDTEEYGIVAVVMVGATNVGKMTVVYDSYISNQIFSKRSVPMEKAYSPGTAIKKGARLGSFSLGSSVILLVERVPRRLRLKEEKKVRYGQALFDELKA